MIQIWGIKIESFVWALDVAPNKAFGVQTTSDNNFFGCEEPGYCNVEIEKKTIFHTFRA